MITMQLSKLVGSTEAIKSILAAKLPIKAAYQLSKIGKALVKELETYEESRVRLIKELGETDAEGNTKVSDANVPEFAERLHELLAVEITVDLEPVSISALMGDSKDIAASDLLACDALFVD